MPTIQFAVDGLLLFVSAAMTFVIWGLNSRLEVLEGRRK